VTSSTSNYRLWIYLFVTIGLALVGLFCFEFIYRYPIWTLRAFSVPSRSMCPTICEGDYIFVQMEYSLPYVPHRNDVIMFSHGRDRLGFIKRVIGVPGDIVSPGPNNTILVNGHPWHAPPVCVKSSLAETNPDSFPSITFEETHIPPGQLFVIGDNLPNSYDSRIPNFEPVTPNKVLGKPVLIYWSPDASGSASVIFL
jgi:signal peptidase I